MILPAQQIRRLCRYGDLVTPFAERTVSHGMTYGLSGAGYDIRLGRGVRVRRGHGALGVSLEHFKVPDDILAQVCDKSSWARQFLFVQNTIIEPVWRGYLTLELTYLGDEPWIDLMEGQPIAQIIFMRLAEPTEQPYAGKYQDQDAEPQQAVLEQP